MRARGASAPTRSPMPTLSSILVQRGAVTMRAVEEAIARQVFHGGDLATNLLELGAVHEDVLTAILAETASLPAAAPGRLPAPPARVLRLVPGELALRHGIFPLELEPEARALVVATAEPLAPAVEDDLGFALDLAIVQIVAPLVRIRQAIAEHYGIPAERRFLRIIARLDGQADPSPSALPPPDRQVLGMKMPRPISIPAPSFGTGVPSDGELGRLHDDKPAAKTPFVASHDFVNPAIPRSPGLPQIAEPSLVAEPSPTADPAQSFAEPPPPSAPTRDRPHGVASTRLLGGIVKQALREGRASAPIDKTRREGKPAWKPPTRRKGPFTTAMAEAEMEEVKTSDGVLEIVFAFAAQFFEYTALFVVHGDLAEGRDAAGPGASRAEITGVGVPLSAEAALGRVRERRAPWIGRLAADGLDADLARDLRRPATRPVAVLPLVVKSRAVALLYGDDGDAATELSALGEVISLIALAGAALERIALRKKLGARAPEATLKARLREKAAPTEATRPAPRIDRAPRVEPAARTIAQPAAVDDEPTVAFEDEPTIGVQDEPTLAFEDEPTAGPTIDALAVAAFRAASEDAAEAEFATSPVATEDLLPPSQGPRTVRYQDVLPEPVTLSSLRQTHPGIGAIPFPRPGPPIAPRSDGEALDLEEAEVEEADVEEIEEADVEEVEVSPRAEVDSWIPLAAGPDAEARSQSIGPDDPQPEPRPTPSPLRRGPAPIFEGRAATPRSVPPIGFEPLPRTPPPNATAWTSFPSAPPPESLIGKRKRSERPIPREDPDSAKGSGRTDHVGLPTVVVDLGAELQSLVQRVIDGGSDGQAAYDELLRSGDYAVQAVMTRFPGPLRVDRHRARAELPAASQCGPVLELLVAFRRPALPFVSGRISSPDPEIRFWAAHVLGELRYPEAATALLPRLFDDDPAVRRVARRSAASLVGAGAAGVPVLKGLEDIAHNREEPAPHRVLAIETMGEIRATSLVAPLVVALADPTEDVADAARRALLLITRQDFGRDAVRWQEWWIQNGDRHRIEWLIDALAHDQPSLRRAAGDELKLVTREYFGYYDDLPKRERERAQSLYRGWWEREGRARFSG